MNDEKMIEAVWSLENVAMDLRHTVQLRVIEKRSDDDVLNAVRQLRDAWHKLEAQLP